MVLGVLGDSHVLLPDLHTAQVDGFQTAKNLSNAPAQGLGLVRNQIIGILCDRGHHGIVGAEYTSSKKVDGPILTFLVEMLTNPFPDNVTNSSLGIPEPKAL